MSLYIIPTHESRQSHQHRPAASGYGRCSALSDDTCLRGNAIPRTFLGPLSAIDEFMEDGEQGYPAMSPWHQHQLAQLRRQEYVEEAHRRQRFLQARQQQALERAKLERERAAWQREQQQRAAALEYHRRRAEAYQRQQQQEYLERARQAKRREMQRQWEQVATQTLFGVLNIAQHLFGDEAESSTQAQENSQPKETDAGEKVHVEAQQTVQTQADDGKAKVAVESQTASASNTAAQDEAATGGEEQQTSERLLFTYPLPHNEAARARIQAQDIRVSFDEPSRTIELKGLWPQETAGDDGASSTVASEQGSSETRGRKRSRSPKRSRVSDVDEQTGEEIAASAGDDDGYVNVDKEETQQSPVTTSVRLPEDASVKGLRAEITDEGFQVWVS